MPLTEGKENMDSENYERKMFTRISILATAAVLGVIVLVAAGCPLYNVWQKEQKGKAALREAEQDRQIAIEEAKANLESEQLNAEAEVIRAKGAAESIRIEGGQLTDNYIKYLWVRQQGNMSGTQRIYIPTEAGLPLLEAGQLP